MGLREAAAALTGDGDAPLRESLKRMGWQNDLLREDLSRIELAMEDEGWRRAGASLQREFTRDGLDDMMSISRMMYITSPLIQRAVNVKTYYTWARGCTFTAEDEKVQDIIDEMTDDYGNRCELYSHQARLLTDVDQQVDGNNFFALFTDPATGDVFPRSLPVDEVREIFHDSDDPHKVLYYKRVWNQETLDENTGRINNEQKTAFYPDWKYEPKNKRPQIGDHEIRWDSPVIHMRTGGFKRMRFGMPETYAALDWARAYKKFLEDWHTLVASLARFAWQKVSKGNKLRDKQRLGTTISEDDPIERNRPPAAGSVWVGDEGEMTPIPKTGAHTSAEDARPSRMMVGAAMDLPDTILAGDADVGNLATAKTLDRPTELAMLSRQVLWSDFHKDIFYYALGQKAKLGKLPAKRVDGVVELDIDADINVTFPEILEHDKHESVNAIVAAATLSGKTEAGTVPHEELAKLLMEEIGVDDIEAALDELDKEAEEDLARAVDSLGQALAAQGQDPNAPPVPPGATPPPGTRMPS